MSLNSQDQTGEVLFNSDHKIGVLYDIITEEQVQVVNTYDKPTTKSPSAKGKYFRGTIENGREDLFPVLTHASCTSFDQSYFTRTIGQINLQEKYGADSTIFSGAGFGVLQAFWAALGRDAKDLAKWFVTDFRDSIHTGYLATAGNAFVNLMIDTDSKRMNTRAAERVIKKLFKNNKQDLQVKHCTKDVFIPLQDISGRVRVVTKGTYPNVPIYQVVAAAIFDPIFFKTKPRISGLGVMIGDVMKNNDFFIRYRNPNIKIVSIGSPVRLYDKGSSLIKRDDLALKLSDQKHTTDLIASASISGPYTRHECTPIDECYQFATDQAAMELALNSGA